MDNKQPVSSGSSEQNGNDNARYSEGLVPPMTRETNEQEADKTLKLLDDCLTFFSTRVMEATSVELYLERKNWPRLHADITCALADDDWKLIDVNMFSPVGDESNEGPSDAGINPETEQGLEEPKSSDSSNSRENNGKQEGIFNRAFRKLKKLGTPLSPVAEPSPNTSQHRSTDQGCPADVGSTYDSNRRGNNGEHEGFIKFALRKLQESRERGLPLEEPAPNTVQHPSTDQANPSGKQTTANDSHAAIPQPSDAGVPRESKEETIRMLMSLYWTGAP